MKIARTLAAAVLAISIASCTSAPAKLRPAGTAASEIPLPLPVFHPRLDPGSGCVSTLDVRTDRDLALLEDDRTAQASPLSGLAVVLFPRTKKELEAWNRLAVAAVRVFSADRRELPVESVLVATDEAAPSIHQLPPILPHSPVKELAPDSPWRMKAGPFVQTVYVFVPIRLLAGRKAELSVRLAGRMSPLTLLRLPLPGATYPKELRSLPLRKIREDERRLPDPASIVAALGREFCLAK